MNQEKFPETWTDIIDQEKYDNTGIALLYRNPKIEAEIPETSKYNPSNHIYSLDPGVNYIFDQQPVAFGFTAYIGHDEITSGCNSLRSNRRNQALGYQTLDNYRNYSNKLFEKYSIEDKKKPRPRSDRRLKIDFYTELQHEEQKYLVASEKFYAESYSEANHTEKLQLREFVDAFIDWIDDMLSELNPEENNFKGLGGLSEAEATYIYKEFKGEYIHSKTKPKHFTAIFQKQNLPDGWKRVEWIGDKTALILFMDKVLTTKLEPRIIRKYFKVAEDKLLANNRTGNDNPIIRRILEESKKT